MPQDDLESSNLDTRIDDVSGFFIEVHLFACGHGDTILVRLPGPKWILIDCHLPKHNGVYDRFLRFLDQLAIREGQTSFSRLDWVILTHPDEDHYLGMASLLEHFTRDGRSLGSWLSSGLNAHELRALAWPDSQTKRGYRQLLKCVRNLSEKRLLRRQILNEGSHAFSPSGYQGRIELFPIAPSAETLFSHAESDLPRVGRKQDIQLEANALSIVLVLSVKENGMDRNFLLAGDAGPLELAEAIQVWHSRAEEFQRNKAMHVIKVPHHGSWESHWPDLTKQHGSESEKVAAVSAGTRPKLPDSEVLRDYLNNGWRVTATTRRIPATARFDRPMTLSNRSPRPVIATNQIAERDVTIRLLSGQGISDHPPEARIQPEELSMYATATNKSPGKP